MSAKKKVRTSVQMPISPQRQPFIKKPFKTAFIAGIAGVLFAILGFFYNRYTSVSSVLDPSASPSVFVQYLISLIGAVISILFWQGFIALGKRYNNPKVRIGALIIVIMSLVNSSVGVSFSFLNIMVIFPFE